MTVSSGANIPMPSARSTARVTATAASNSQWLGTAHLHAQHRLLSARRRRRRRRRRHGARALRQSHHHRPSSTPSEDCRVRRPETTPACSVHAETVATVSPCRFRAANCCWVESGSNSVAVVWSFLHLLGDRHPVRTGWRTDHLRQHSPWSLMRGRGPRRWWPTAPDVLRRGSRTGKRSSCAAWRGCVAAG